MPGLTLTRLRIVLTVFFALDGFVFAGWVVRIPAIKEQTDATAGTLGLALLGVSAGAVVTMTLTGRLCRRHGSHPVTVVCAVLLCLGVMLPPLAHSALTLGLVLLVFGSAYGGINVAFNSAAVDLVTALRRPIMPTFHAAFSLGGMLGAGLGALVAGTLSPTVHLVGLGLLGLAVTAVAGPALLRQAPAAASGPSPTIITEPASPGLPPQAGSADPPGGPRAPAGPSAAAGRAAAVEPTAPTTLSPPAARTAATAPLAPGPPRPSRESATAPRTRRLVLVFGLIALCTAYGEGALADWGALHLRQDLGSSAGAAAIGYSCFALAMTVGRLTGTTLLERLGRTLTVVAGGSVAAAGMLLGALAPALWAALLGYLIAGLGLANLFPVAVERAGALAGPSGVATASTLGYGGMLLGPPAIGFLAEWLSLSVALTSVAALAALAALIGFATRRAT
ncbi:MFS transporter [Streptomyces sp. SS7]|uniref:MFS transporter n=1 Tax=Streptomyces sp. SS7 TaxID=3108485 RepID=UPI0030EC4302